jgi:prepilin-type N-terminal cleavage/methylation domain-containing protein
MVKSNRGISLIESLVCIVIIGIGFIAIMQLSAFTINSMDRATEKNKLNYLSEMVMEDMIGDPDNASKYGSFSETCGYANKG